IADIERETGHLPRLVATTARAGEHRLRHDALRARLAADGPPELLILGTGWGLTAGVLARADDALEPIQGTGPAHHPSAPPDRARHAWPTAFRTLEVRVSRTRIDRIEAEQLRKDVPAFRPGDTVRVHVRVVEGDKERIQVFEGTVIGRSGGANREMFTVRKTSYGVGVERIFPVHSPRIERVEVVMRGSVRRAKLYYLRERSGRAARVAKDVRQKPEETAGKG